MIKVLLIHGVNADTSWQDSLSFVLRPHFEPVKVTYEKYQTPSAVSLLSLEGILRRVLLPVGVSPATLNGYRMNAMKAVADQMTTNMGGAPPHIIAHSFGTYLTSIIFRKYDWPRANRIIFAGSAVAEDFPWKTVWRDHLAGKNFNELRNDWFPTDVIINLVDWVRQIPELGCAGARGFTVIPGLVHNLKGPAFPCSNWKRGKCVPVHNVQRDIDAGADPAVVDHSLVYLTPANVAQFWLPYLWGIDAAEYDDLRALSRGIGDAYKQRDEKAIGEKVEKLRVAKYSWWPSDTPTGVPVQSKPFQDHLREVLNSDYYKEKWKGKKEVELLGRIPAIFLARMDKADATQSELIAHSTDKGYLPDEAVWDKVRDLNPHSALCQAIYDVLLGD